MSDIPRPPRKGQDPPAARHLKLVKPSEPKPPPRPKGKRPPTFSAEEQARLCAALKNARWLFGTWACLADALRVPTNTLHGMLRGRSIFSADLAVRLARALGKPLETLYAAPSDAALCAHCGARRAP